MSIFSTYTYLCHYPTQNKFTSYHIEQNILQMKKERKQKKNHIRQ